MHRVNNDRIDRVAVEFSLKPFGLDDGVSFDERAEQIVTAWRPLWEAGAEASFMLWVADGEREYGPECARIELPGLSGEVWIRW